VTSHAVLDIVQAVIEPKQTCMGVKQVVIGRMQVVISPMQVVNGRMQVVIGRVRLVFNTFSIGKSSELPENQSMQFETGRVPFVIIMLLSGKLESKLFSDCKIL
jgi:hypothetical protein